jgi:glycosyltransferase involved in cell wall biosynthesis
MKKIKILFGVYPWAFDCPGGGERQLIAYRDHLRKLGVIVDLYNQWDPNIKDYDIFHFFSVMPGSYQICKYIKEQGLKLFISPNLWVTEETKYNYPHDEIKQHLEIADKIIVNSYMEAEALSSVYKISLEFFAVVHNGVEDRYFQVSNKNDFLNTFSLQNQKFILNVANIEPRKNQDIFLKVLKKYPDLKFVVIGNIRDQSYYQKCIEIAGEQLIFIGSLDYNSNLLHSAYLSCEFFAMPSTLETPSIAALEASATGAKILITKEGSTKEYFQDYVSYVEPYSFQSIENAIENILKQENDFNLKNNIKKFFNWEFVCKKLKLEYEINLEEDNMKRKPVIYFDCTSTIRSNLNTGVQRVVRELINQKEIFEEITGILFVPICHQYNWYYKLEDALEMTEKTESEYDRIQPVYNDIYFCADSYWSYDIVNWFPYFKNIGAKIVTVCYDLIPINHSNYSTLEDSENFEKATNNVLKYSDLILCISNNTKYELMNYIENNNIDSSSEIKNFKLGSSTFINEVNSEFDDKYKDKDYMLMVGTIEPRREYYKTILEFEKLWENGSKTELYIVGKNGTQYIEFYDKLRMLSEKYPIYLLSNIDDKELSSLYKNTQAVIVSSNAEGYGLPLSEAMQYNKPVYANRLKVFGEFAGSYPIYFDINKKGDLFSKLANHKDNFWFDSTLDIPTWEESVKEISEYIVEKFSLNKIKIYSNDITEESVQWAYKLYFNKEVDENTVTMWLDRCKTVEELVENLIYIKINSNELTKENIQWAYKLYFNKNVDEDGLNYWLTENDLNKMRSNFIYELQKGNK